MDFQEEMETRAQNARFILDLAQKYGVPPAMLWNPSKGATMEAAPAPPDEEPPEQGAALRVLGARQRRVNLGVRSEGSRRDAENTEDLSPPLWDTPEMRSRTLFFLLQPRRGRGIKARGNALRPAWGKQQALKGA